MKRLLVLFLIIGISLTACNKPEESEVVTDDISAQHQMIKDRLAAYAPVEFNAKNIDISHLSERQIQMLHKLTEAGKVIDKIFWKQSTNEGTVLRDSLAALDTEEAKDYLHYLNINFGPYDVIYDQTRFVGKGAEVRPEGGGFYPVDMTREEFNAHLEAHPECEKDFKSQYTVIVRDENGGLKAVPYSEYFTETDKAAQLLMEAADLCDNESFKKYLIMRAEAMKSNEYFESDLQWMSLEGNDIDIVIGPIENYEDEIFNYKTSHEVVVMVKDPEAGAVLQIFKDNMNHFQSNLPTEGDYKSLDLGEGNVIQVVNVVYFGGDCMKGTKTIAAALPNDPKVAEAKGRKLSMYINHMKAKYQQIVKPIAEVLLSEEWLKEVDEKAFTNFVTLHEVSHALGPKWVNKTNEDIREALENRYSAIEEAKADILSMFNHKLLFDKGIFDAKYIKQAQATYLAGLYRSIRFGTGAHCTANFIQLNFLQEFGAIAVVDGKFVINEEKFFDGVAALAKMILDVEANGDLDGADKLIAKYGQKTPEIEANIERLKDLPRDIDTRYKF